MESRTISQAIRRYSHSTRKGLPLDERHWLAVLKSPAEPAPRPMMAAAL